MKTCGSMASAVYTMKVIFAIWISFFNFCSFAYTWSKFSTPFGMAVLGLVNDHKSVAGGLDFLAFGVTPKVFPPS